MLFLSTHTDVYIPPVKVTVLDGLGFADIMDAINTKRHMTQQPQGRFVDENTEALATIGMKIRKSIADGYNVPGNRYNGYASYNAMGEANPCQMQNSDAGTDISTENTPTGFARVPLPAHLNGPPGLDNSSSTMGTSSNLEEWNHTSKLTAPVSTLENAYGTSQPFGKRKFSDYEASSDLPAIDIASSAQKDTEHYRQKYGDLHFDEDF